MGNSSDPSKRIKYLNSNKIIRYRSTFRIVILIILQPSTRIIRRGVVTIFGNYEDNSIVITTLEVWARLVPIDHEVKRRKLT